MADEDYEVVLEDMDRDALHWDAIAGKMAEAEGIIEQLKLGFMTVDGISVALQFKAQYDSAHQTLAEYITAGRITMEEIAQKVRDTRALYEEADI